MRQEQIEPIVCRVVRPVHDGAHGLGLLDVERHVTARGDMLAGCRTRTPDVDFRIKETGDLADLFDEGCQVPPPIRGLELQQRRVVEIPAARQDAVFCHIARGFAGKRFGGVLMGRNGHGCATGHDGRGVS